MVHGALCFGNDQQTAGIFINPVHQTWPVITIHGKVIKMINQGVNKRSRIISMPGMHHHTGRFVYHQQNIVFINYIQRNIFPYQ